MINDLQYSWEVEINLMRQIMATDINNKSSGNIASNMRIKFSLVG